MGFRVAVKDYQAIRQADVDVDGITFLSSKNNSGKSTLIKALRTMLDNASAPSQIRHGAASFSMSVTCDGRTLQYGRDKDGAWEMFGSGWRKTKLGRLAMNALEPDFPFRRVDCGDVHFYPNLAQQNAVPVFDDISVVDLFSVLFSQIARLAQRQVELKRDVSKAQGVKDAVSANLDYTKTKRLEAEKSLADINARWPHLESDYARVMATHGKKIKFLELSKRQEELRAVYGDHAKQLLVPKVESARGLFNDYTFLRGVSSLMGARRAAQDARDRLAKELDGVPDVGAIVQAVVPLVAARRKLADFKARLVRYPDGLDMAPLVAQMRKLRAAVRQNKDALERIDSDMADVHGRIARGGCPILAQGMCPARLVEGV